MGFFGQVAFFGQPAKCEVAHTSFRLAPLKSGMATSIWRQEGTHGTKTRSSYARICLRDSSCDGGDHPSDHDARFGFAELVTDLPSSTSAFVLRRSTNFLPPTLGARRRANRDAVLNQKRAADFRSDRPRHEL